MDRVDAILDAFCDVGCMVARARRLFNYSGFLRLRHEVRAIE